MASKTDKEKQDATANAEDNGGDVGDGIVVNASGHKQELDRNFGLFSICAVGIVTGNAWAALGGSIVGISIFSGEESRSNVFRWSLSTMEALQVSFTS